MITAEVLSLRLVAQSMVRQLVSVPVYYASEHLAALKAWGDWYYSLI